MARPRLNWRQMPLRHVEPREKATFWIHSSAGISLCRPSAFINSGHSNVVDIANLTGRKRPRLCKKSLDFAVNGTAHHIGNESQATKTSGPTSVTCQSKCRSRLRPLIVILRFCTASFGNEHPFTNEIEDKSLKRVDP